MHSDHIDSNGNNDDVKLARADFPVYFQALESKPIIVANNAREHEDTCEFTDVYLKPLNIYSMMDCPIVMA